MHELSIVLNIIDMVEREARNAGAERVKGLELLMGRFSTIEPAAFDLAWQQAIKNTLLQDAELVVRHIPGKARCLECGHAFSMEELYDPCPQCGSHLSDIVEGKELKIQSITIE